MSPTPPRFGASAPYERACLVESLVKRAKPRAKLPVLNSHQDPTLTGALFRKARAQSYAGMIEYRPQSEVIAVDAARSVVKFDFQDNLRADVLTGLAPMRAGAIAVQSELANANERSETSEREDCYASGRARSIRADALA